MKSQKFIITCNKRKKRPNKSLFLSGYDEIGMEILIVLLYNMVHSDLLLFLLLFLLGCGLKRRGVILVVDEEFLDAKKVE